MLKRLRVTTMYEKTCLFLAIVLYVAVVSESRVIVSPTGKRSIDPTDYEGKPIIRRSPYNELDMDDNLLGAKPEKFPFGEELDKIPQENPKENDVIDKSDDESFNKPLDKEDSDEFGNNDTDLGPSLDEDKAIHKDGSELEVGDAGLEESEEDKEDKEYKPEEEKPDEEKEEKELDEEKPDEEKWEEEENEEEPDEENEEDQENPDEKKEEEKLDEEKFDKEKEEDELDEEKREEENEEKPDEEKEEVDDQEKPDEEKEEELGEENPDEEKKEEENEEKLDEKEEEEPIDNDNEEEKLPKEVDEETDGNDSKNKDGIPQEENAGSFKGGSIFNTPFFNLEKVKNYFSKIDRVLGHAFQETVDEALLMNGTYTNTTEEEVDIKGKKYIVTKSLIKGADNHSSMYIESLSAKPKMNDIEEMKDIEIKNLTQT